MDEKDRLLLICLQSGLPLTHRPFDSWVSKTGIDSAELLVRIQRLKKEGILGGMQAILDPKNFHYQSAWVAMRIGRERHVSSHATSTSRGSFEIPDRSQAPAEAVLKDRPLAQPSPQELESRTEALWQHPGVIYGCEREHAFNVWFFVAVPGEHDLELHVRCMEKLAGAEQTLFLPARRILKGTGFLSVMAPATFPGMPELFEGRPRRAVPDLTGEEIRIIRQLQEPFPLTDEPFQKIAADLGITETQALERMRSLVEKGCLKHIGSLSKPAPTDLPQSILVVWQIPEEKLERMAPEIAEFREVLYADQREAPPEFPYSLYTLIRAGSVSELELTTRRMQDRLGKWPHRGLVTIRELKKKRMRYFPEELDAWWFKNRRVVETAFNRSHRHLVRGT